jgi:hypothetical protein
MRRTCLKKLGPFSYFHVSREGRNFISVWLTKYDDSSWGWEWGTDNEGSNPSFCVRLAHFNMLSYESFRNNGYILWILGFWFVS